MIERSKKSVQNQIKMIDKLRTLKKIEGNVDKSVVDLNSLIERAIEDKEERIGESELVIEFKYGDQYEVVGGKLLKEVFSNIIENSIEHSKGNKILISLEEEDDYIVSKFEDDGIGLEEKWTDKIFEKGLKVEDSGGAGLGTFLIKRITELYDGKIEVGESSLGGAEFRIKLKKP